MLDEFVATEIQRVARLHVANICQHHHAYTTTCFVTPKRVYGIGGGGRSGTKSTTYTRSPPPLALFFCVGVSRLWWCIARDRCDIETQSTASSSGQPTIRGCLAAWPPCLTLGRRRARPLGSGDGQQFTEYTVLQKACHPTCSDTFTQLNFTTKW